MRPLGIGASDAKSQDALEQAVRVLDEDSNTSQPIQLERTSLMYVLSDHGVAPLRLYALLNETERTNLADMKDFVRGALS